MSNTPRPAALLVLARAERRILQQIRLARSTAKRPNRDRYVMSLVADWFTRERPTGLRQVLSITRDAFDRGADETALLGIADELRAEIESWYELARGIPAESLASVHQMEEKCEGVQEDAELELVYSRSPGAAARFIEKARQHVRAIKEMINTASAIRDGVAR